MEPLTILSAAAAASAVAGKSYELVNWIRELCQGVKTVDERVQRLKSGVSELARACESVHAVLQPDSSSTTLTPPWDKDGSLATSINHQASNCRRTLKELKEVLTDLRPGKSSRISRHMKLQDRGKQIDGLSARISTHTNALQMSLQIATIKIALATPDFVIRELREALRDTRRLLGGTESITDRPPRLSDVEGQEEDQLVGLAQDALRRGTTLYEASVAGSTVGADSVMGNEKAVSVGKWIHETGGAAQDTTAPGDARSRPTLGPGNVDTRTAQFPNEYTLSEASMSCGTASEAASSSCDDDDTHPKPLPVPEMKSAPSAESSDLRRPPPDLSRSLNQMNRAEIVSRFKIEFSGEIETMICTGNNVDSNELLRLLWSKDISRTDAFCNRERNKLALHFAVLFQDLFSVGLLVDVGYSPNLSAQVSDIEPLSSLLTPIEIAIASRSELITKFLLENGAQLNPMHRNSPCLQLFATPALVLWPTTRPDDYTETLRLLLRNGFTEPGPNDIMPDRRTQWSRFLHQICDLPTASLHLRLTLVILVSTYTLPPKTFSPLHAVVMMHDLKLFEFFLEALDTHALFFHLRRKDDHGRTPLVYAIERVNTHSELSLDIVHALLKRRANLYDTVRDPSKRLWGYSWKNTSIRGIAMRSERADLRELVAKY
jgi:ankyrin repeat protein